MNNFSEGVVAALGLSKDATEEQVLKAIADIKSAQFSEDERKTLTNLKKAARVSHYTEELSDLTVSGDKAKMASDLYDMEDKMGIDIANTHLSSLQDLSTAAGNLGVTEVALQSRNFSEDNGEDMGKVEARIAKYAEDEKITTNQALAKMSMSEPTIVSDLRKEKDSN